MLDQFGINVAALSHNYVYDLKDLNVDLVQVPLHLGLPDKYVIDMISDTDTHVIGKLVPDPKIHDRAFFRVLCQSYKNCIQIWDFGGEPETRPDQPGCRWPGTAKEFVALFRQFREEAKTADPECLVGAGGFLAPTFNGLFGNDSRFGFLEELFCEGLAADCDYFSINLYVRGYGGCKNFVAGILMFKELLARYGQQSKPIIVSETGVPCGGDPQFLHIIQTPERQAVSLLETHLACYSLGIDYSIWYTYRHPAWGIVDESGTRRPAFAAFKNMIRILKGCQYKHTLKALPSGSVQERWLTDKISWHVLVRPDGKEVHVVYLSGGNSLPRLMPAGISGSCDMYGSALAGNTFMLDAAPKYFAADPSALHPLNFLVY